jgi:hypothetical protein
MVRYVSADIWLEHAVEIMLCGIVWLNRLAEEWTPRWTPKGTRRPSRFSGWIWCPFFDQTGEIWWISETLETRSVSAKRLGIS